MKKIGWKKIAVEMRTAFDCANALVENPTFNKFVAFIPIHQIIHTAIIGGMPVSITEQELKSDLRSSNKIVHIKRLNKRIVRDGKVEYTLSITICIKFVRQIFSRQVTLYFDSHIVSPFVPRVKSYFSCYRIGHNWIKMENIARIASDADCVAGIYTRSVCERQNLPPKCINCEDNHLSISSACLLFVR